MKAVFSFRQPFRLPIFYGDFEMKITEYEKEQIRQEVERIIGEFVVGGLIGIICFCVAMVWVWKFYGFLG